MGSPMRLPTEKMYEDKSSLLDRDTRVSFILEKVPMEWLCKWFIYLSMLLMSSSDITLQGHPSLPPSWLWKMRYVLGLGSWGSLKAFLINLSIWASNDQKYQNPISIGIWMKSNIKLHDNKAKIMNVLNDVMKKVLMHIKLLWEHS